jgi:hypothetical protein
MSNPNYKAALGLVINALMSDDPKTVEAAHATRLEVGHTPPLLIALGMPDLPLVITGETVDKALFDHGMVKTRLEKLYEYIQAPKAVFASADPSNPNTVVMTFEVKNGGPIIVPIEPNRQFDRTTYANKVASFYAKAQKSNDKPVYDRWEAKGLLLWKEGDAVVLPIAAGGNQV